MDQGVLAEDKKRASRLGAWLVFIDESGFLLLPSLRRTWAPKRRTPVLAQCSFFRRKVSAIAALCVNPQRARLKLCFRLHPDTNIASGEVIAFLRELLKQLPGHIVLILDRFQPHRSKRLGRFLSVHRRLRLFFLPPYAPDLNPVEGAWSYLKMNSLANWAPPDPAALATKARQSGRAIQHKQSLLRSFLKHTPLPLRLK